MYVINISFIRLKKDDSNFYNIQLTFISITDQVIVYYVDENNLSSLLFSY